MLLNYYNIKEYGACGDNKTLDSPAIQKAIDDCNKQGGGTVYCPPGTYLIGTIILKKNVNLYLDNGTLLLGSTDKKDYPACKDGKSYLIYAEHTENLSIKGSGTIDGSGNHFFVETPENSHDRPASWRPRALMHFVFCKNVTVENITLSNSSCYTLWPLACDIVRITGIKIFCNPRGPNTDGIDIDCCKDTIISNCYIECGDDAIAVKSDAGPIGIERDCENLVVSNCVLSSTCSGIRLGYEGDGKIKNCLFNNIVIKKTWLGIDFLFTQHYDGNDFFIKHGSIIENVTFSNMTVESVRPIHMWIGDNPEINACIRKVKFSNISFSSQCGIAIYGAKDNHIHDISFSDIDIDFSGKMDLSMEEVPYQVTCFGHPKNGCGLPYGVFCRYADNLEFKDVKFSWENASGTWLNPIKFDNANHAEIKDLHIVSNDNKVIETVNSTDIKFNTCE